MRNKRSFTTLIVIGLLAVLTTTIYAVTSAQSATPGIVGAWEVTIPQSEGNPRETFYALQNFFADGNFVGTDSQNPALFAPVHGIWIGSNSTYLLTFETFTFDEQGKHNGKVRSHHSIKMDGPDHFIDQYVADRIDLAGKVTKKVRYGSAEGTRLEVELP